MDEAFRREIIDGYALTQPGLALGSAMKDGQLARDDAPDQRRGAAAPAIADG